MPAAGKRPASTRPEAFALVFETNDAAPPAGGLTHRLSNRVAGAIDIHLGTRFAAGTASRFLAVFN